MKISFRTNKGTKVGELIKENKKTVWVKFKYEKNIAEAGMDAIIKKFVAIIKRHKIKHNVVMVEE